MIELKGISVRFGKRTVLDNLSLHVGKGRTTAILGPNGRGKTTLLRTLLGQQRPDSGTRRAPAVVGYVPQAISLAHPYNALDVVIMGRAASLGLFGRPGAGERAIAIEAMHTVGVGHLATAPFDHLSGGERQLVLLARAIATGADVFILDEPAAALDLHNEKRLLDILRNIGDERGKTIILTTHDPNHALGIADDALLMMPDGSSLFGPVGESITTANLSRLYGVDMQLIRVEGAQGDRSFVVPSFALCRKCPAVPAEF